MIQADWTFAIWALLCALAALGFWSDRTRLGRNVSGLAIVLATGMLLSNLGIAPKTAPAYGVVWSFLVPVAIPLLLLKANLRRILKETRGMLLPFMLGATGTTIGALLGVWLLPLGEHSAKLAGVFSATYIGGSMNMAAVTQALELEPALAIASVAADNVVGVVYLGLLALAPSLLFLQRWFREGGVVVAQDGAPEGASAERSDTETLVAEQAVTHRDVPAGDAAIDGNAAAEGQAGETESPEHTRFDPIHIGIALALSFGLCFAGHWLAERFGLGGYSILFITTLAVVFANLFPGTLARLQGDYTLGLFFMYLFFAAIGLSADVAAMITSAPVVAVYAAIIVACHALVVFGVGRFVRSDLMDSVIASNACSAGPASAAAMAAGKGRPDLVAPAVLLGVFGYAIANFIGIGLATALAG